MKEVQAWFDKAKDDFQTAKYNLKGNRTEAGLFFLQQAAEKALKALYIKKFKKLIKVHDLVLLAKRVNAPKKIIECCKVLSPAYQYTRYPDVSLVGDINKIAKDCLNYCEEILKWVEKCI